MKFSRIKRKVEIALRTAGPARAPKFASLFITRKCNLACPYCRSIDQPFADIDFDGWKLRIDRLYQLGCRIFTLTGGEPLVRKDLMSIVSHIAQERKAICWIISNFGLMSESVIDQLADAGVQFITCSLDSLGNDGSGKSNGRVLDLLSYAKKRNIICSTLTVVSRDTIDKVSDIIEAVTRRGIIFDMGLFQHVGGLFSPESDDMKAEFSKIEKLRNLLRRKKLTTGLVAPSWGYLKADLALYEGMGWKCTGDIDRFLVVNNNGSLMACQEYDTGIDLLSVHSLKDPRWRRAKAAAVDACLGCFYGCYYQKEHIRLTDVLLDAWTMLRA